MDFDRTPTETPMRGEMAGTSYSVYAPQSRQQRASVVLIHGVGMSQRVWAPQVEPLLAADFQVVVYDMLGHGGSVLPPVEPVLGDYAGQLEALLDGLGIARAHVVGHSMGALVALEFALTRAARTLSVAALNAVYDRSPDQREAVMSRAATLGDTTANPGDAADAAQAVDATLRRWFGDPVPAHLTQAAQAVRHLLLSVNAVGYARTYRLFACSDDVHVGRLTKLSAPALFLTGECDLNSSAEMSRAMADAVPRGRVDVIADARHMMNVSHPDEVTTRLLAFFAEAMQQRAADVPNMGEGHV
ncbi:alpha/beta fold hydrolase [Paraburkholderia sp. BL21I4N1]|uniref:alpha/beta fold hydrolase n=1 Tax=Paraburkholderia sp. BL21I4N1 TaxID=1938801 RepID=UPI000CFC17B3|nr:alpha/beta fold hydrolase [Paraburkholderia sp. BL21I4N1]PQV47656.1 pimeloyl-ACP methyl ester carboxylesterase [Paraburkholderia sp. BL21I4N1]